MNLATTTFKNKSLYVFEQHEYNTQNKLEPFAYTDLLTKEASLIGQPILHFWELDQTVILGMKDIRLPQLSESLTFLKKENYHYLARNSGGLAVVADRGILNLSLIIPLAEDQKISITDAYDLMLTVISQSFADFNVMIEAKEVSQSYCPGDYDLSINGQKFAGIAQRRIRGGIAVMIYLSVHGPQQKRGELIQGFYQAGLGNQFGQLGYPAVDPSSMANLDSLLDTPLNVDDVKQRIINLFQEQYFNQVHRKELSQFIQEQDLAKDLDLYLEKMVRRNSDLKQIGADKT